MLHLLMFGIVDWWCLIFNLLLFHSFVTLFTTFAFEFMIKLRNILLRNCTYENTYMYCIVLQLWAFLLAVLVNSPAVFANFVAVWEFILYYTVSLIVSQTWEQCKFKMAAMGMRSARLFRDLDLNIRNKEGTWEPVCALTFQWVSLPLVQCSKFVLWLLV